MVTRVVSVESPELGLAFLWRVLSLSMVWLPVFTNIYLLQIKGITLGPTPLAGLIFIL